LNCIRGCTSGALGGGGPYPFTVALVGGFAVSFFTLATVLYHEMKDYEPNVGKYGTKLPYQYFQEGKNRSP
jgi:hypothetical protein